MNDTRTYTLEDAAAFERQRSRADDSTPEKSSKDDGSGADGWCPECEEWVTRVRHDASFDHEFGTERAVWDGCELCGEEKLLDEPLGNHDEDSGEDS